MDEVPAISIEESWQMINEEEGETIFKSAEDFQETLDSLAKRGLIKKDFYGVHCQMYNKKVDVNCPLPKFSMPLSPNDPRYLYGREDLPTPSFDPMFDIACRHVDCSLYLQMVKKIIYIHEAEGTRKFEYGESRY